MRVDSSTKRPTAINLRWALEEMRATVAQLPPEQRVARLNPLAEAGDRLAQWVLADYYRYPFYEVEPALRWYTNRQASLAGLSVEFQADTLESRLDPAIETACFRVAQEDRKSTRLNSSHRT